MEVNRLQTSPNFGMALRIKPEAVPRLKEYTRAEVKHIQEIAEQLDGTTFWHIFIGENKKITDFFANDFF